MLKRLLPIFGPTLQVLALCALALLPAACLKSSKSKPSTATPTGDLIVVGRVHDDFGAVMRSSSLYLDDSVEPAGQTDDSGQFKLTIPNARLAQLYNRTGTARQTFRVYAESASDPTLLGASEPIDASARGERRVGEIRLTRAASVEGTILVAGGGSLATPAANAAVNLGRDRIRATTSGTFKLERVPAGKDFMTVSVPGYADVNVDLDLQPGEVKKIGREIVLFPVGAIAGTMTLDSSFSVDVQTSTAHPFVKRFNVAASSEAKFLRYHHDPVAILQGNIIPWHSVTETVHYDFPHDAGNTLYFQFANANQDKISELYQISVVIDQYADSTGIVIEDGSGIATRRTVMVKIDVPKSAYRMRLSESVEALPLAPWQSAAPLTSFVFNLRPIAATGQLEAAGLRELYCQFIDAYGLQSQAFRATVVLQTFPIPAAPMLVIDGGAAETPSRLVRLDIQVPPAAAEMRIFEAPLDGAGGGLGGLGGGGGAASSSRNTRDLWMPARSDSFYTFSSSGLKTLYLQFRSIDGGVSPVYQQVIRVLPYPPTADVGFVINGGATQALSRHLTIDLLPPPGSMQFRIWDAEDGETSGPWRTLVPRLTFSASRSGTRTILVKYRSEDLEESGAYAHPVQIDPFPVYAGNFVINAGSGYTSAPLLALSITPPPTAKYFAVAEGNAPDNISSNGFDNWLEVPTGGTFLHTFLVRNTGSKTIYLRFQTADNELSTGSLEETVFYDPFPAGVASILINGGAATTTDPILTLALTAPATFVHMRIGTDPLVLQSAPFTVTVPSTSLTLPATPGLYKVYVQFETAEGERSPVYFDEITLQ